MPSTPLAINRPDPLVPQFRDRPLATFTTPGLPIATPVMYPILPVTSDVLGIYFTFWQTNGVAGPESMDYWVLVDGTLYIGNQPAAVDSQVYYVYRDTDADVLLDSVNRVMMKADHEWYGHTMGTFVGMDAPIPAGARLTGSVLFEQL